MNCTNIGVPRLKPFQDASNAGELITVLSFVFLIGMFISAAYFYADRPFDWTAAIISDLQSPEENPYGFWVSALATGVTGILLLRLNRIFDLLFSPICRGPTLAASRLFALGALGALLIGCSSPFPVSYETIHVPLAFSTFICLTGGIGGYLTVAAYHFWPTNRRLSVALLSCCTVIAGVFLALVWIHQTPDFFSGGSLWTTLALWEWLLCLSLVTFLMVLASVCRNISRTALPVFAEISRNTSNRSC